MARDSGQDGRFVYGVSSTRVYCRPSCPSRRPLKSRVHFFESPTAAEGAGFRACRRCRPRDSARPVQLQVQKARQYIDLHPDENVSLKRLGEVTGMSPYHLQRTFKKVLGLSPKAYATARRLERMKQGLKQGLTVSRATYEAGYGSGSRAYQQAGSGLGMTPGSYRKGGKGVNIRYTLLPSECGQLLAAATERGLCAVMLGDDGLELEGRLRSEFPAATVERNDGAMTEYAELVLDRLSTAELKELPLDLNGTDFQWLVWEALRRIPAGETRSYQAIAQEIGRPGAARAVARACAGNRLALVIPCHRAVQESGDTGGYRWGPERKRRILQQERRNRDGRREVIMTAS